MENKFDQLKDLVDNSTTVVYIPAPKDWKCERCTDLFKHTHTTYNEIGKSNRDTQ